MFKRQSIWALAALTAIAVSACAGPTEPAADQPDPPPPDPAVSLMMTSARLAEANATAAAFGLRSDAIGYIDAGESGGNKTLYLRDFGITDPNIRVTVECHGYNINGDPLPARGVVSDLRQGINSDGFPMVALDGTPIIRFDFEGGWHEVCGVYIVTAEEAEALEAISAPTFASAPAPASVDDLIGTFDIGESGGAKRLFLRDFGLTDPDVRVTILCTGVNINGDVLPQQGSVTNLFQGTSPRGWPMVDADGTPVIRFDFTGGWHEVCGLYHYVEPAKDSE